MGRIKKCKRRVESKALGGAGVSVLSGESNPRDVAPGRAARVSGHTLQGGTLLSEQHLPWAWGESNDICIWNFLILIKGNVH